MLALSQCDTEIDVSYYSYSKRGSGERPAKLEILCYWIQPLLHLNNKKDQYLRRLCWLCSNTVIVVCVDYVIVYIIFYELIIIYTSVQKFGVSKIQFPVNAVLFSFLFVKESKFCGKTVSWFSQKY